jgi:hypothetical protein
MDDGMDDEVDDGMDDGTNGWKASFHHNVLYI